MYHHLRTCIYCKYESAKFTYIYKAALFKLMDQWSVSWFCWAEEGTRQKLFLFAKLCPHSPEKFGPLLTCCFIINAHGSLFHWEVFFLCLSRQTYLLCQYYSRYWLFTVHVFHWNKIESIHCNITLYSRRGSNNVYVLYSRVHFYYLQIKDCVEEHL